MEKLAQLAELKKALAQEYIEKTAQIEEAIIKEAANTVVVEELAKLAEGNVEKFVAFVKKADQDPELYAAILRRALSQPQEKGNAIRDML